MAVLICTGETCFREKGTISVKYALKGRTVASPEGINSYNVIQKRRSDLGSSSERETDVLLKKRGGKKHQHPPPKPQNNPPELPQVRKKLLKIRSKSQG